MKIDSTIISRLESDNVIQFLFSVAIFGWTLIGKLCGRDAR